jgi:hypothetical protein
MIAVFLEGPMSLKRQSRNAGKSSHASGMNVSDSEYASLAFIVRCTYCNKEWVMSIGSATYFQFMYHECDAHIPQCVDPDFLPVTGIEAISVPPPP